MAAANYKALMCFYFFLTTQISSAQLPEVDISFWSLLN